MDTKKLALAAALLAVLTSCTAAGRANLGAIGSNHKVLLYSGGQLVGQWESYGVVHNEGQSDGFYFEDAKTHKLIELTGTVVIEQE